MTKPRVPIFTAWPRLPEARFRDLHLACAGHCRGKKTRVRARFDHIAVGLIVGGQGYYSAGGRAAAAITPGALFGVYPGPIFDYGPLAWWEEYYIGFAGRGVRGLIESGLIPRDGRPRQVYDVRLAVRGFEEVIRTWRRRRPGDGDRACLRGLMLLVDLFSDPLVLGASKKVDPIEAVLALCRKRPGEPLDFHQLAADHNISYSTLR
ncbi:MAG: hypothetical protein JWM57_1131, partial [Phycisphaerales bacterium]|nr:hypothetical protein [Phycisphaerales bacterium]